MAMRQVVGGVAGDIVKRGGGRAALVVGLVCLTLELVDRVRARNP